MLRLAYILIAHTYRFKTTDDNFGFGFEMGRIGRALASGQGFSNPFHGITGPTAWEPPLYPFLIAAVFKLFGIYSKTSAIILLSINSLFSALTCIPIFRIANRCFGATVARWSSWLWAVFPPIMFWSTRWIWETSLASLLLAIIFWLTLVMEANQGRRRWLELGLLWGAAALTNTSLLAFMPACFLWILYTSSQSRKRVISRMAISISVFILCIAPWLVHNYETFGKFIFIRSNFGAELRLGNGPGADGTWMEYLHPTKNAHELNLYRQMGEVAYVAQCEREAIAFIRADKLRFAKLCILRFIYYWGGVPQPAKFPIKNVFYLLSSILAVFGLVRALQKRKPDAWLFFWLVLCYPLVFYITFPHPRYRHPIEPELGILMVYLVSEITLKSVKRI